MRLQSEGEKEMTLHLRPLTKEEEQTIKKWSQSHTEEARLVERAKIIWQASQGQQVAQIAEAVSINEKTVRKWLKRFDEQGVEGLELSKLKARINSALLRSVPMLGGRPVWIIARNVLTLANYRSLWRMRAISLRPMEDARRYLRGWGEYPYEAAVRTPLGVVRPSLDRFEDLATLTEVFFREEYRAGPEIRTVVDIGSNIGLSALYFLTRHPEVRCHCFEPDPRNFQRLRKNLADYADRIEVYEHAVADTGGQLPFGREPTGRYGGLDRASPDTITVTVRGINEVLSEAITQAGTIDVLKIDIEGAEIRTVRAIEPALLDRVRVIYFEDFSGERLHEDQFAFSRSTDTTRLVNRRLAATASP
jgi:FkbM family methyltransferase